MMNTELFAAVALVQRAAELTTRVFPKAIAEIALIGEDIEAMALWAKTNLGANYSYLTVDSTESHVSVRFAVAGKTLIGAVFFEPDAVPAKGKSAVLISLCTAAHLLQVEPHELMIYPCRIEKQEPEDWTHLSYPAQHAVAALEEEEEGTEEASTPVEAHLQSYRDKGLIVTPFPITGVHTGADALKEKWRSYMVLSPTDEGVAGTRIYCTDAIAVSRDSSDAKCTVVVHPDRTKVGVTYTSSIIAYILLELDKDFNGVDNVLEEYEDGSDEEDDELEVSDFVAPKRGSLYRHIDGGYCRVQGLTPVVHAGDAAEVESVAVLCIWPDSSSSLIDIHPDAWMKEFTAVSEQSLNYSMKRDRFVVQAMIEANRHQREMAEQDRQDAAAEDPPLTDAEEEELAALVSQFQQAEVDPLGVTDDDVLEVVDAEPPVEALAEGQVFRHTDGGYYHYLTQGLSSEDRSPQVVYEHVWPFETQTWVRPLAEWNSRFTRVTHDEVNTALEQDQVEAQLKVTSNKAARRQAQQEAAAKDGDAKTADETAPSPPPNAPAFLCHVDGRPVYSGSLLFDANGIVWEARCLDSVSLSFLNLQRTTSAGTVAWRWATIHDLFWEAPSPAAPHQEGGAPLAHLDDRPVYPGSVLFDTSGKSWRVRCLDNMSSRLHLQHMDSRGLTDNYVAHLVDAEGKPCLFWSSPVLPMTAYNPEALWKK